MEELEPKVAAYRTETMELYKRIVELIPSHPEILLMENPHELSGVEEFNIDDLNPSLGQISGALLAAQEIYTKMGVDGVIKKRITPNE